jgi:uncharacterized Zn-finger protein
MIMTANLIKTPATDLAPAHPVPEVHDVIPVKGLRVSCDGGGGALGHPQVWLTLDEAGRDVRCPYCSRYYVEDKDNGQG